MTNIQENSLLDRVVQILEQARANVVRAVNSNMVTAYWLIGREIVQEVQGGEERAAYGKQVIENLSRQLTDRYGKGFSAPTLWKFRQFYQAYSSRDAVILSPAGIESDATNRRLDSGTDSILSPSGTESAVSAKGRQSGDEFDREYFSIQLSWSHYRALMRVDKPEARLACASELAISTGYDKGTREGCPYKRRLCVGMPLAGILF